MACSSTSLNVGSLKLSVAILLQQKLQCILSGSWSLTGLYITELWKFKILCCNSVTSDTSEYIESIMVSLRPPPPPPDPHSKAAHFVYIWLVPVYQELRKFEILRCNFLTRDTSEYTESATIVSRCSQPPFPSHHHHPPTHPPPPQKKREKKEEERKTERKKNGPRN